jgi:DinB superfamily
MSTKTDLQDRLKTATADCLNATASVSDAVFFDNSNGKWSIAENLIHLAIVAKRFGSTFTMPKEQLANFGLATQPSRPFDGILAAYMKALEGMAVAPKAFVAVQTADDTRTSVIERYNNAHNILGANLMTFSEEELDKYQVPHPLLGLLTMREMMDFIVFHLGHHQKAVDRIVGRSAGQLVG